MAVNKPSSYNSKSRSNNIKKYIGEDYAMKSTKIDGVKGYRNATKHIKSKTCRTNISLQACDRLFPIHKEEL